MLQSMGRIRHDTQRLNNMNGQINMHAQHACICLCVYIYIYTMYIYNIHIYNIYTCMHIYAIYIHIYRYIHVYIYMYTYTTYIQYTHVCVCLVVQSCLTFCNSIDCSPPGSSVHGDFQGKNTGVNCYALLQAIFPSQGQNPGLLHCRWILY